MIHLIRNKFYKAKPKTLVYAVGGGKGGIGKSFISSNLALYLSQKGYRTLVIDLDFGGANAHTYLDVKNAKHSAKSFLCNEISDLQEAVAPSQFRNLSIITGASDWNDESILNHRNMDRLFKAARSLGFDRIVYDLGAGTNSEIINAFLEADIKIAVSTPEPISIENTYQFLKRSFYNSLKQTSEQHGFADEINSILKNKRKLGIRTPADLIKYISHQDPATGQVLAKNISAKKSYIIVNQCRAIKDERVGKSLAQISRQFFGQNIQFLGNINYENKVWQSVRSMRPLIVDAPECHTIREFRMLFRKLESTENYKRQELQIAA